MHWSWPWPIFLALHHSRNWVRVPEQGSYQRSKVLKLALHGCRCSLGKSTGLGLANLARFASDVQTCILSAAECWNFETDLARLSFHSLGYWWQAIGDSCWEVTSCYLCTMDVMCNGWQQLRRLVCHLPLRASWWRDSRSSNLHMNDGKASHIWQVCLQLANDLKCSLPCDTQCVTLRVD